MTSSQKNPNRNHTNQGLAAHTRPIRRGDDGLPVNHNQTILRYNGLPSNHNQTIVRYNGLPSNHNQTIVRRK